LLIAEFVEGRAPDKKIGVRLYAISFSRKPSGLPNPEALEGFSDELKD